MSRLEDWAQDMEQRERDSAIAVARAVDPSPSSGICCDCGDDIDGERLKSVPHARRCVDCQGTFERKGRRR